MRRILGKERELGTIEPGKRADITVIRRHPLFDIVALSNVDVVIKHGVPYREQRGSPASAVCRCRPTAYSAYSARRYTFAPMKNVSSTLVFATSAALPPSASARMSRSSTMKSADFPASIDPATLSRFKYCAPLMV